MMKKLGFFTLFLCLFFMYPLFSEQIWQGNAAVIRRGGFETSGLYAASNSFPKNTKIEVMNLENGKVVTVTVLKRIEDDSNVFLLLSTDAAEKLDMEYNDVIRVKTKILAGYGTDIVGLPGDLPYNPDEDINPAAGAPDEYDVNGTGETSTTETFPTNGQTTDTHVITPPTDGEKTNGTTQIVPETEKDAIADRNPQKELFTTPHEDTSVMVYERAEADKQDASLTDKDIVLKDAEVEAEEKPSTHAITKPEADREEVTTVLAEADLPLEEETATAHDINKPYPDKEDVTAALPTAEPPGHEDAAVTEIARTTPESSEFVYGDLETPGIEDQEKPTVDEMAGVEPVREELIYSDIKTPEIEEKEKATVEELASAERTDEEFILSDLNAPDVEEKERPDLEDVNRIDAPERTELVLVPTDPRPPTEAAITETDGNGTEVTPDGVEVTTSTVLFKDKYYLQIGAYKKKEIAEKVAKSYTRYPMNIVATHSGRDTMYKVLIGPLTKDEGGAVLYWFKAKGHRDAFLKYIKE
jgi:hypothetical protein